MNLHCEITNRDIVAKNETLLNSKVAVSISVNFSVNGRKEFLKQSFFRKLLLLVQQTALERTFKFDDLRSDFNLSFMNLT